MIFIFTASLKNLGDKAGGLFDKKKKEATDLANEKVKNAQHLAEEQANKAGQAFSATKDDVTNLASSTAQEAAGLATDSAKKAAQSAEGGVNQAQSAVGNVASTIDQTKKQATSAIDTSVSVSTTFFSKIWFKFERFYF
jgi:predicted phage tail protein